MDFPFDSIPNNSRRGSRPSLTRTAHILITGGSGVSRRSNAEADTAPTDTGNGQKERPWD